MVEMDEKRDNTTSIQEKMKQMWRKTETQGTKERRLKIKAEPRKKTTSALANTAKLQLNGVVWSVVAFMFADDTVLLVESGGSVS